MCRIRTRGAVNLPPPPLSVHDVMALTGTIYLVVTLCPHINIRKDGPSVYLLNTKPSVLSVNVPLSLYKVNLRNNSFKARRLLRAPLAVPKCTTASYFLTPCLNSAKRVSTGSLCKLICSYPPCHEVPWTEFKLTARLFQLLDPSPSFQALNFFARHVGRSVGRLSPQLPVIRPVTSSVTQHFLGPASQSVC